MENPDDFMLSTPLEGVVEAALFVARFAMDHAPDNARADYSVAVTALCGALEQVRCIEERLVPVSIREMIARRVRASAEAVS